VPTGVISPANGNREERTVRVEGLVCRLPSTLSAVFYRHALKWWVGSVALGNLSGRCATPNISAAPSEPITETQAGLGGVEALAVIADELVKIGHAALIRAPGLCISDPESPMRAYTFHQWFSQAEISRAQMPARALQFCVPRPLVAPVRA